MKHESPHRHVWPDGSANLLLFADDSPTPPESPVLMNTPPAQENSRSRNFPPSLAQITAEWQALLKRLGRRRRILETILRVGHPMRLVDNTLVLGFPPQRRFQQELLDMPDYRGVVEEELKRTFHVQLSVVTALSPDTRQLPSQTSRGKTPA
jgi:hypothetical protein